MPPMKVPQMPRMCRCIRLTSPNRNREIATVATSQVTAIAKPVTSPVSSALRRMWPTIRRYQIMKIVKLAVIEQREPAVRLRRARAAAAAR